MRHLKRLLVGAFLGGMLTFFFLIQRGASLRAPGGRFADWSDESWMRLVLGGSALAALGGALFAYFTGRHNDRVIGDIATVPSDSSPGARPREATFSLVSFFLALLPPFLAGGSLILASRLQPPTKWIVLFGGLSAAGLLTALRLWRGQKQPIDAYQTGGRVRVTPFQAVVVIAVIIFLGAAITIFITQLAGGR